MPVKKNGCWIYEDWRKVNVNANPVTCPERTTSSTTVSSTETSTPSESISELAVSELSLFEEKEPTESANDDDGILGLSEEEREKFVDGMVTFQERYQLPVTGRLDASTELVINHRICGVPDNPSTLDVAEQSVRPTTDAMSSMQMPSTILSTLLRGDSVSHNQETSEFIYETVTDVASVTVETELSYTEVVTEMSSEVGGMMSELAAVVTPTSSNIQRTFSTDGREGVPSADTSRRKRQSFSNNVQGASERRSKRSSPNGSRTCLDVSRNSVLFWKIQAMRTNDPNGPLIPTSSDITTTLLKKIISGAFRRWAEVSTLRFREAAVGQHVDIYLRFIESDRKYYIIH